MIREFMNFLRDEDGQTSTEYILLVAVVAVIILKFKDKLQGQLDTLIDGVFGKANNLVDELN
tara:strand:- start:171 stop:356 length:186 start_codon:yes stop_codon:yes gene_type:complete